MNPAGQDFPRRLIPRELQRKSARFCVVGSSELRCNSETPAQVPHLEPQVATKSRQGRPPRAVISRPHSGRSSHYSSLCSVDTQVGNIWRSLTERCLVLRHRRNRVQEWAIDVSWRSHNRIISHLTVSLGAQSSILKSSRECDTERAQIDIKRIRTSTFE